MLTSTRMPVFCGKEQKWCSECSHAFRKCRDPPPAVAVAHDSHQPGQGAMRARTSGRFPCPKREEQRYLQSYQFFQAQQCSIILSVVEEGSGKLLGATHSDAQLARRTFRPKCNTLAEKREQG